MQGCVAHRGPRPGPHRLPAHCGPPRLAPADFVGRIVFPKWRILRGHRTLAAGRQAGPRVVRGVEQSRPEPVLAEALPGGAAAAAQGCQSEPAVFQHADSARLHAACVGRRCGRAAGSRTGSQSESRRRASDVAAGTTARDIKREAIVRPAPPSPSRALPSRGTLWVRQGAVSQRVIESPTPKWYNFFTCRVAVSQRVIESPTPKWYNFFTCRVGPARAARFGFRKIMTPTFFACRLLLQS